MISSTSVVDLIRPSPMYGSEVHWAQPTSPELSAVAISNLSVHQTTLCLNYVPVDASFKLLVSDKGKISCPYNSLSVFWSNYFGGYERGTIFPFSIIINSVNWNPGAPWSEQSVSGASQIERSSNALQSGASDLVDQVQVKSGMTLEEVAPLLGVTRRSLQHWRKGKAISTRKERRLRALVDALSLLPAESPALRRRRLLERRPDGVRPYDLLAEGQFGAAHALMTGDEVRLPNSIKSVSPSLTAVTRLSTLSDGPSSVLGKLDVRRSARLKR
ncbi:hypothetical protein BRADO0438 [Bradyrhizobium sp. ORS 278]|uniref:helix-turn-helix domain-containing protein n=1 Tax=Bradyrhizobium sp. (strain ORS 278) TaxID=114615 RepID=UPI0001507714|nr:helix-turn-helix transcriptional regulator [Bradyrhizobium sp. ORS 278]CAL74385.1 hypothetical protein BRADO0438 [Bradyrhizobium sp. ORS 278]